MKIYSCKHIGVSGTTDVFVEQVQSGEEEIWEPRMGYTNHENWVSNPFSNRWRIRGFGTSEEKAIRALKRETEEIVNSLWA